MQLALGDGDAAFAQLDRAVEARAPLVVSLARDPLFDPFRADPRYHALLRRMKLEI